ncbi:iron-siderophore ABC transporter substrate-binding protein [Halomonas sp.]|uniref:iron-siderophore ABC transporter substrate-binding protein n=1 Tax=Halomonas sp. TaxID=1486246 RepID=UPI00298E8A32|nr:iron-siderophore ABC transporter substrate-binding protein [Halomonas sp.]MDW7745667.1 iron-siderophore ABC transporter substrate-binding protein [Halomonas sp.]
MATTAASCSSTHAVFRTVLVVALGLVLALFMNQGASAAPLQDDRGTPIEATQAKRVAAISTFAADTLVALGVSPVGASTFGSEPLPSYLGASLSDTRSLGQRASTNLELLTELNPELIIGIHRYTEPHARQLEAIAPFYAFDVVSLADSRRAVTGIATALGKRAEGEALNQAFDARLAELGDAPGGVSATLLAGAGEAPFAYYDHFLSAALLERLNATNAAGPSPTPGQTIPFGYTISLERLLALNPDVIFLFATGGERAFANNPVWPYLEAVKNGRVFEVGPHWKEGGGPIARRLILDEMAWRLYPEDVERPELPPSIASHSYP